MSTESMHSECQHSSTCSLRVQTDYDEPSSLHRQRARSPRVEHDRERANMSKAEANHISDEPSRRNNRILIDAQIHQARQSWLQHQDDRFATELSLLDNDDSGFSRNRSPQSSATDSQCSSAETQSHTGALQDVLRQLDHVERLLQTYGLRGNVMVAAKTHLLITAGVDCSTEQARVSNTRQLTWTTRTSCRASAIRWYASTHLIYAVLDRKPRPVCKW